MEYPVLWHENSSVLTTAIDSLIVNGSDDLELSDLILSTPPLLIKDDTPFDDAVSPHYLFSQGPEAANSSCLQVDPITNINDNSSEFISQGSGRSAKWFSLNRIAHNAGRLLRHKALPNNSFGSLIKSPFPSAGSCGFLLTTETEGFYPQPLSSDTKGPMLRKDNCHTFSRDDHQNSISQISQVEKRSSFNISFDSGSHGDEFHLFGVDNRHPNNLISFLSPSQKRAKTNNIRRHILEYCPSDLESQGNWHTSEDSFSYRAQNCSTTHPRSISERVRRTRINKKLKKLHEVVPNMHKESSYSEMLDFAVEHLEGLQDQVQKLRLKLDTCKCERNNVHL